MNIQSACKIDGGGDVTISAADPTATFQFFAISNVTAGKVEFVGLTLTGANETSKDGGGAIFTNGADVTVTNCTFTDNTSNYGGAIGIQGTAVAGAYTTVTVTDCTFTGNKANIGGASRWLGPELHSCWLITVRLKVIRTVMFPTAEAVRFLYQDV